nr:reverse transcriptase domain-containing protein [Tanacetum cinerariifolium]
MADNRTMVQMLQTPIEGYEDAIVVPPINANNFDLKQTLINLVQSNQFTRRQDPHNHLRFFNKVTSTFRHPKVPNTTVKVTDVRANANATLSSSSHSNSFDLQQIAAALEDKLDIRMNRFEKSLIEMKNYLVTPTAPLKAVTEVCVTCGLNHSYNQCPITRGWNDFSNLYNKPSTSSSLPSNTIPNPKGEAKAITTRNGMSYKEPLIPPTGVNQQELVEVTTNTEPQNSDDIHPPTVQAEVQVDKPTEEPAVVRWVSVLDMQVTLHDMRIVMQVTLHYEAIVMQVTLHDKRIVMQVTLHYEAIVIIKIYIDTKPNNEYIHYYLQNPPYKSKWTEKTVPVAEGGLETTIEWYMVNYKNVSQDIRNQLNEAEAVQIILTGIENDIYFTIDAFLNAYEMWKEIEKLKQEWKRSQLAANRNRGKAIANPPLPIYDQEPDMVAKDDALSKEKEIDKLMDLISLSFNKIYKPTNNNLKTSSNTSRAHQDNTSRINR